MEDQVGWWSRGCRGQKHATMIMHDATRRKTTTRKEAAPRRHQRHEKQQTAGTIYDIARHQQPGGGRIEGGLRQRNTGCCRTAALQRLQCVKRMQSTRNQLLRAQDGRRSSGADLSGRKWARPTRATNGGQRRPNMQDNRKVHAIAASARKCRIGQEQRGNGVRGPGCSAGAAGAAGAAAPGAEWSRRKSCIWDGWDAG